ncbi:MAG: class I SAM-dependent methyltransferase [Deltaproteobacteria bacterium]|nr:class I SAM-dependent methyltransferase [Deltaproteobacteria bacterium]
MEPPLEQRKIDEMEFHNRYRAIYEEGGPEWERFVSNKKFYAIDRASRGYVERWLRTNAVGKRVLDYGCGGGAYSLLAARSAARVDGVDISDESVRLCRERAAAAGVADKCFFHVMDCENLGLPDDSFDVVCESGVLHHLDLTKVWPQMVRVLSPDGLVICTEALVHNPLFQLYRRLTPHLRTVWETEHILSVDQILGARRYFQDLDMRFFHLATLAAVPFRRLPVFGGILSACEAVDSLLLRIPVVQRQAWMSVFTLGRPLKSSR